MDASDKSLTQKALDLKLPNRTWQMELDTWYFEIQRSARGNEKYKDK